MKVLFDTHTFIWWDSDIAKLSPLVLRLCNDPATIILLSVVSVWEMHSQAATGQADPNNAIS